MWIFVALLVLCLSLWLLYRKNIFSTFKKAGIPGPEPNLLFGNILEIFSKNPLNCHTEWIKKYGKVVGYYHGTSPILLIADVDILKQIEISGFHNFMNRGRFLSSRPLKPNEKREGFSEQLVNLQDKSWKDIRSILTPSFTTSKMKQMSPLMNDSVQEFLSIVGNNCSTGESFDIYPLFQGLTMHVIGKIVFGIQTDCQKNKNDTFLRSSKALFSLDITNPVFITAASFRSLQVIWDGVLKLRLSLTNKGIDPIKELVGSTKRAIMTRRQFKESRRPDLLQIMLDAEVDTDSISSEDLTADAEKEIETKKVISGKKTKKMTDDVILDNSVLFLLAGYETTSTALAFISHVLITYPEIQEKIRSDVLNLLKTEGEINYSSVNKLPYLDQVIQETLRLYPPVYGFVTRVTQEDINLGDISLKKGMTIQVPVYDLHRDPELWEEPDEFRPERFAPENKGKVNPLAFQPFGAGPRNCIGMRFALMEIKLAIAELLSKYKLEPCSKTEGKNLTMRISQVTLRPKNGVWTKVIPVETTEAI